MFIYVHMLLANKQEKIFEKGETLHINPMA